MIGARVGRRYEVSALLSEETLFTRYAARDMTTGREVTLRVLRPPFGDELELRKALTEVVERHRSLGGPLIEAIERTEAEDGQFYLVGDLTRGPTLQDRIRRLAPFSIPVAVGMAISLGRSLEVIHRAGMVHGDLQSAHAVVMANGETRLQMAGIWAAYRASERAGMAALPDMAPYLAPEITAGGEPTISSDIYAVGVLLFQLLTGRPPFMGESVNATLAAHRDEPEPSVRSLNPSAPQALDDVVATALAKDPAHRYASVAALLGDLRLVQDALRFGRSVSLPSRVTPVAPSKPSIREPGPVAPRMSAARHEENDEGRRQRRSERDVPVWMLVGLGSLFAVTVALLGVWLMFNLSRPKLVQVPDVRRLSVSEARDVLERMKLEMRIADRVANERAEPDQVISVDPEPGTQVREGGRVNVTISLGSRMIEVPDVKGLTLDRARAVLEGLALRLSPTVDQVTNEDVPAGTVVSQLPEARTQVARMSEVKLVISTGDAAITDDAEREYVYTLTMRTVGVTRQTQVRIEMLDNRGIRDVFNEPVTGEREIKVEQKGLGPVATFRIFYNNRMVREVVKNANEL